VFCYTPLFSRLFCYTRPRMTPEERDLLQKTYKLVEENNTMLRKVNRKMFYDGVMKVVYYGFIIGGSIGAFYLVQPYIDSMKSGLEGLNGTVQEVNKTAGSLQNGVSVFSTMEENLKALTGGTGKK